MSDDRPDWLPAKFETPDALVEAYRQALQKISALGAQLRERDELIRELETRVAELREVVTPTAWPQRPGT